MGRMIDYNENVNGSTDKATAQAVQDDLETELGNGTIDDYQLQYSSKGGNLQVRIIHRDVANSDLNTKLTDVKNMVDTLTTDHGIDLPSPADERAQLRGGP